MKQDKTPIWAKYLPDTVLLHFVDYNDNLNKHPELFQECLSENTMEPISDDSLCDLWDFPENMYMNEMREKMENDGLEECFDNCHDEILDEIMCMDESTPAKDLLRNTNNIAAFYSLGVDIDGYHTAFMCDPWCNETEAQKESKVRRALKVKKNSPEGDIVHEIVENAPYGGDLRIYFNITPSLIKNFISDDALSGKDGKPDFKSIKFSGRFVVAVQNPCEGSGWFEEMDIDLNVPFQRSNLMVSKCERYSMEEVCGLCGDWLDASGTPSLSYDKSSSKKKLNISSSALNLIMEKEYNAVFKNGGCTREDTDIKRHRDVYYDNNVPCGWHCPHCGAFWID